jgi:hypothetical protein
MSLCLGRSWSRFCIICLLTVLTLCFLLIVAEPLGLDILPWAHKAAVGEEAEATPQLFETWGAGLHVFALHQVRGG